MSNYNRTSVPDLIPKPGYLLDWLLWKSNVDVLAKGGVTNIVDLLFAKMPKSEAWNLQGVRIKFLVQLKRGTVFDRGKELHSLWSTHILLLFTMGIK